MNNFEHNLNNMIYYDKKIGNFFCYKENSWKKTFCIINEEVLLKTKKRYKITLLNDALEEGETDESFLEPIKLKEELFLELGFMKPSKNKPYNWGNLFIEDITMFKNDGVLFDNYGYIAYLEDNKIPANYSNEEIIKKGTRLPFVHCFQNFIKHHSIGIEIKIDHILPKFIR